MGYTRLNCITKELEKLVMDTLEVLPTTSCEGTNNSDDNIISFVSYNTMTIIVIILISTTLVFCCLSVILCTITCILCHKKHRTSHFQDHPKSNGYVMPVVKEEKELLEPQELSTDTFRPEVKHAITNKDVQRDIVIQSGSFSRNTSELLTAFKQDFPIQTPKEDIDNPMYIRHDSLSNEDSVDRKANRLPSAIYDDFESSAVKNDYDNSNDDDKNGNDYENIATNRLAKIIAKQGISLPLILPQATSLPSSPTSPKSKQNPPETKPKPKQKQRTKSTPSERSITEMPIDENDEEPHYMSPRPTNQIPWNNYKELDFKTVDPTGDYTVPTRGYFTS